VPKTREVDVRTNGSSVLVQATPAGVWGVLTDPALTRSCLLGLAVDSTFEVGSDIRFHGPGGTLLGGRVLAHEHAELLTHTLGDLSRDLVKSGLEEHDPSCWVTWTVETVAGAPPTCRVGLTVDVFDDEDDVFSGWCDALNSLARVLAAAPPI
jgi:uncharacterized protein YndB with AHSA1/START domain